MRIVLLSNPRSGRGRGEGVAAALETSLRQAGHEPRPVRIGAGESLETALRWDGRGAEVLAVVGGDGTLHHALPAAIDSGAAVYHVPMGTENLFAREFGMDRTPERLLGALERGRIEAVDAGVCNGTIFSLMCGVGPDAAVIHRLQARRAAGRGAISHLSYVRPIATEVLRPTLPPLTVVVDGETVFERRTGVLIIANSGRYALGIDLARSASMSDGRLDVVFFPCPGGVLGGACSAAWMAAARLRVHDRVWISGNAVVRTGRRVRVESEGPAPCQIDGEASGCAAPLDIGVMPGALRVLRP